MVWFIGIGHGNSGVDKPAISYMSDITINIKRVYS